MKIIGADLSPEVAAGTETANTVVALDAEGSVQAVRRPTSLPGVAVDIADLAAGEPFLAGINLPVVVPHKAARQRPIEGIVRRKLGYRLPPAGRAAQSAGRGAAAGEALLGALAASGHPALPYPDRDGRRSGVAEIHPGLAVKTLLWEGSPATRAIPPNSDRAPAFRAYAPPDYRSAVGRGRSAAAERAVALDLVARAVSATSGFDLRPVFDELAGSFAGEDAQRAASLLDACVIAGTARRYLRDAEACVFLGDRESGYVILPADGLVRRLVLGDPSTPRGLFPNASLRDRLGAVAELRAVDLLELPGKPQKVEAVFTEPPAYEFDNLDELLWWKHCRHLAGPLLPTEGLDEMVVTLGDERAAAGRGTTLRLVRSRHRTLSFRFDPPAVWRSRVPTRDGRTYRFQVLRATFATSAP